MIKPRNMKVFVTGLGVLAANGNGKDAFWKSLLEGKSGIGPVTLFDATHLPCQIAGEVKRFRIEDYEPDIKPKRHGRHSLLALAAMRLCMKDAGLAADFGADHNTLGLFVGVSSSAFDVIESGFKRLHLRGAEKVSPYLVESSQPHAVSNLLGTHLGNIKTIRTYSSACNAGVDALIAAYNELKSGRIDVAIVGGTDAPITPLAMASFSASGMIPSDNGVPPARASRPFDSNRTGGILAEGAGFLVLETETHAYARGAAPYVQLSGYGLGNSGDCDGFAGAMSDALANAGLATDDVDYVCAHAPSDVALDAYESEAIKKVFRDRAYHVPISSIKGATGNPLSAAGPLQLITCALSIRHGLIPPTANFEKGDGLCDLDYVPMRARRAQIRHAVMNTRGMGSTPGSFAVSRIVDDDRS